MLDVLRAAIFASPDDDAPRMVYAERCDALPALRELVVSGAPPGWRDRLLASPIAGRLARLEVA